MFSKTRVTEPGPRNPSPEQAEAPRSLDSNYDVPASAAATSRPRTSGPSVLSADLTVKGNIQTQGDIQVEGTIEGATVTTIIDRATALTAVGEIEALFTLAKDGVAKLGTAAKRINDQSSFVADLADSLKAGIGALVDADMEEASARLQALQTQQQLGVQALSIANQAPQTILALFK